MFLKSLKWQIDSNKQKNLTTCHFRRVFKHFKEKIGDRSDIFYFFFLVDTFDIADPSSTQDAFNIADPSSKQDACHI